MYDAERIKQILEGRTGELEGLIRDYYGSIYTYCYRHVGNKMTAEDLTQDVFERLIRNLDGYRHYGKLQNYLYVIAGNLCRDHYKKHKPVYLEEIEIVDYGNEMNIVEDKITAKEALNHLSDTEREAVILRYYHDCKYKDIAKIMQATVSITKYRVKRAEEKLADYWKEGKA